MGGGASSEQRAAAASQQRLNDQTAQTSRDMLDTFKAQEAKIEPYATDRLNNGLPFYGDMVDFAGGNSARAFAPARAAVLRSTSSSSLPSGYRDQLLTDLEAKRAQAFDQDLLGGEMTNEAAKTNAAALLTGQQQLANPLGWTSAATQGNQAVMQAPLQSPGLAGMIGGLAGGVISKIPF